MAQTPFKMQEMLLTRLEIPISYDPAVVSTLLHLEQVGCPDGQSNLSHVTCHLLSLGSCKTWNTTSILTSNLDVNMEYPSGLATKATSIYSPLSDWNEIRLLGLQPRRPGEGIKCTTRHVKLSEKPQYEALSYMWGPKEHRQIEINGTVVEVRQNLGDALLELRLEKDTRTLWIDAICINQDDVSERNHQVTQMGTIYKNAVRCVAWLGLSDSLLKDAFTFLVEAEDTGTASNTYDRLFFYNSPSQWDIHVLKGLVSLCLKPYWGVSYSLTATAVSRSQKLIVCY